MVDRCLYYILHHRYMQVVVSYDFLYKDGSTVPFFSMKSLYQLRKYFRDGEAEIVQYCD